MHHLQTLRLQCLWKDLALFVLRTAYRYFFGLETGANKKIWRKWANRKHGRQSDGLECAA